MCSSLGRAAQHCGALPSQLRLQQRGPRRAPSLGCSGCQTQVWLAVHACSHTTPLCGRATACLLTAMPLRQQAWQHAFWECRQVDRQAWQPLLGGATGLGGAAGSKGAQGGRQQQQQLISLTACGHACLWAVARPAGATMPTAEAGLRIGSIVQLLCIAPGLQLGRRPPPEGRLSEGKRLLQQTAALALLPGSSGRFLAGCSDGRVLGGCCTGQHTAPQVWICQSARAATTAAPPPGCHPAVVQPQPCGPYRSGAWRILRSAPSSCRMQTL